MKIMGCNFPYKLIIKCIFHCFINYFLLYYFFNLLLIHIFYIIYSLSIVELLNILQSLGHRKFISIGLFSHIIKMLLSYYYKLIYYLIFPHRTLLLKLLPPPLFLQVLRLFPRLPYFSKVLSYLQFFFELLEEVL